MLVEKTKKAPAPTNGDGGLGMDHPLSGYRLSEQSLSPGRPWAMKRFRPTL